jgi:hypothetical protein
MSSINLNLVKEEEAPKNTGIFSKSLITSILILIITGILYGALLFINKNISTKIQGVDSQYQEEYNKFLSGNANEIIDFKNRNDAAGKLLSSDQPMNKILAQIESSILPAVYLDSLSYDKDKKLVLLSCFTDNFNTVAKQILSFKQNDYFSAVIPGPSLMKEQNKLNFSVDLKIK